MQKVVQMSKCKRQKGWENVRERTAQAYWKVNGVLENAHRSHCHGILMFQMYLDVSNFEFDMIVWLLIVT